MEQAGRLEYWQACAREMTWDRRDNQGGGMKSIGVVHDRRERLPVERLPMEKQFKIMRTGNGGWQVQDVDSTVKPEAGDTVTWEFAKDENLKAFLQFPDSVFDEDDSAEDPTRGEKAVIVSKHKTAQVDLENKKLGLKLSDKVMKGDRYQYAVFVVDKPGGHSGYAIGHNPPPEINVGP
jgi:hypothetical protein